MAESALRPRPLPQVRPTPPAHAAGGAVFAQRKATVPAPCEPRVAAPRDSGHALDAPVQRSLEHSFGADFSAVRIHDDARAHDSARAVGARAYTAGNDIVFGEGAYRPSSASGRALLAHELAHTLQQDGVQMKGLGPLPASRAGELEREADRAALAATSGRRVGSLTRVATPAIFKSEGAVPAAGGDLPESAGPALDTAGTPVAEDPAPYTVLEENPVGPGATTMVVQMGTLQMPRVKGKGAWVEQAYKARASGGGLIFRPKFKGGGSYGAAKSIAAFAEKPGEKYKNVWLNNYGFTTLPEMARAFREAATAENADPTVKAAYEDPAARRILDGYRTSNNLRSGGCDIDHIVEKQLGGTSTPGNLQLLVSDKNQESGRETYKHLKAETDRVLSPDRLSVIDFQMRFNDVQMQPDESDGSFVIETALRSGKVKGAEDVQARAGGVAVSLEAGGNREVIHARAGETTDIGTGDRRLIPGMKLKTYTRHARSNARGGTDTLTAELASKPVIPGAKDITLVATVTQAPQQADGAGGQAAERRAVAAEFRKLALHAPSNRNLPFHYPYLSPGTLTQLSLDDSGNLSGEGVIRPSIRFLGDLKVRFGPDRLDLVQDLDVDALNKSAYMRRLSSYFRFTRGSLAFDLVNFQPRGDLGFTVGPARKPVIDGSLTATVSGGNFIARGTLTPAQDLPGITAAEGSVTYHSQEGWSGLVRATSSALPRSETDVRLGFTERGGVLSPFAEGAITTRLVRDAQLRLGVRWSGGAIAYSGAVTIPDPMPRVRQVRLAGRYTGTRLFLTGDAQFQWKSISATMTVNYSWREGDEDGRFSGRARVALRQGKLDGHVDLSFDERGRYWGQGRAAYQLTDTIRPALDVTLERDGRIKLGGSVELSDIALSRAWPRPGGGEKEVFRFRTPKFSAPTPVPSVTAYVQFYAGMGVKYGVGPVMLTRAGFAGSLYPLEDDMQITAEIHGEVRAPAFGTVYGRLGATIGAEVLLGAVGAKASVELIPSLSVRAEAVAQARARYAGGKFAFDFNAYAEGGFRVGLDVDIIGTITAAYGWKEWEWRWNVGGWNARLGPDLRIDFGRMGYDSERGIAWPSLSNIRVTPDSFDPKAMMRNLLESSRARKA
ncbi:DUF4157 domain-containing protein [Novosphingobium profundi]|uniref:DUF4157 domain-containing protein n=1 Tax=Novosphingobium profundi TaxID=1774954 RepID=UPI001CFD26B6|nr:DUF4157 domain-containing protein [Novosphingobium profundi]